MEAENFAILNLTKGKPPRLPFVDIKDRVLGKKYDLSLVFIGDQRSKKLNKEYRGKDKPTNVLSFPLTKDSGEILINLHLAKKQARKINDDFRSFVGFLFIHGLLHLKGYEHGSRMERMERSLKQEFDL